MTFHLNYNYPLNMIRISFEKNAPILERMAKTRSTAFGLLFLALKSLKAPKMMHLAGPRYL